MSSLEATSGDNFSIEQLLDLLTNESKVGVLLGLLYFKSLNLSQIAGFIDKSIPTAHHHVKQLAVDGLIELDNESITKTGKYYTLSAIGRQIMAGTIDGEKSKLEKNSAYFANLAAILRSFSFISKNICTFLAKFIEENNEELARGEIKDPNPTLFLMNLKLHNSTQEKKLVAAFDKVIDVIAEIQKESNQIEHDNPEKEGVTQFIYALTTPISTIPIE